MSKINTISHIFSCFFMCGLIWTIQWVHYPSFSFVKDKFLDFHSFHSARITWIVLPIMFIELITAGYLVLQMPQEKWLWWNGLGVGLIWLSTAFLSVPFHNQLSSGFSENSIHMLVLTNWVRTILWSLRSAGWLYFLSLRL